MLDPVNNIADNFEALLDEISYHEHSDHAKDCITAIHEDINELREYAQKHNIPEVQND